MPETRISAQTMPSTVDSTSEPDGDDDGEPHALQQDRQELARIGEEFLSWPPPSRAHRLGRVESRPHFARIFFTVPSLSACRARR